MFSWASDRECGCKSLTTCRNAIDATQSPGSMGPSENDLELLSDNRTIMAVIRPDGDSACSSGTYRWYTTQLASSQRAITIAIASRFRMNTASWSRYNQAFSTDDGETWTRPSPMTGMGCARPRLKRLPTGPLLLSGCDYK